MAGTCQACGNEAKMLHIQLGELGVCGRCISRSMRGEVRPIDGELIAREEARLIQEMTDVQATSAL